VKDQAEVTLNQYDQLVFYRDLHPSPPMKTLSDFPVLEILDRVVFKNGEQGIYLGEMRAGSKRELCAAFIVNDGRHPKYIQPSAVHQYVSHVFSHDVEHTVKNGINFATNCMYRGKLKWEAPSLRLKEIDEQIAKLMEERSKLL